MKELVLIFICNKEYYEGWRTMNINDPKKIRKCQAESGLPPQPEVRRLMKTRQK